MLAVGDSTELEIIFSTRRYTKTVSKRPRIKTNEDGPEKNVSISATVVTRPDSTYPIVIRPYKLDISQFGEKKRDRMKFTIANVSDETLSFKLIATPDDLVEIKLPDEIGANKSAEGIMTLREGALEMSFEKSFTFEAIGLAAHRFTVPIKRNVQQPRAELPGTPGETSSK